MPPTMRDNVLLVDDKPSNLMVFEEALSKLDVVCIKAKSGEEAFAQLAKHDISLILLDIQMPDMDGFEILKSIRSNDEWKDIPVIFISAIYKSDIYQIKGIELGAIDFIVKPIIPELLTGKIKLFLELYDYRKKQNTRLIEVSAELKKMVGKRTKELELKNKQLRLEKKERKATVNIINASPIIAFRWRNTEGLPLEYVSENVKVISGYSTDELLSGKVTLLDIVHPDDLDRVNNELVSFSEDKEKSTFTHKPYRILKKNGEILWVDERIILLRNSEGFITHFQGIILDITDKKKAELELAVSLESLHESEDLFRTLSESSFECIFLSKKGMCIMQNKTAEEIFGYTADEAYGRPGTDWIIPEDREKVMKNMMSGVIEPYIVTALRKDGTTFPCEIKARISTYKSEPIRITSLTDISKRVEAEKKLVESEKQYRSLIQDNLSVIMVLDPDSGKIIEVNNACCTFYGYSREDILKLSVYDINALSKSELDSEMQDALCGKKNYFALKHKLANGKICDVEIYSGKIKYDNKEVLLSVIHDISEKVKTSKELIIAKERAEESDRLKTAFLANMSHEIRTPMNAILGFSQLLAIPGIKKEEIVNYIDTINNSGKQLLNLIDDIISISQIEAGIIDINIDNTSVNKILEIAFKLFSITADKCGLILSYDNKLPENYQSVLTDPRRIQQVLINLLGNAIKFTSQGRIDFGCRLVDKNIEFYVSDTGIGIKEADKKIIFDRFMKVDHGKDVLYAGTGIGLSISKAIIEKLGGRIWIVSKKTKGSEFRFTIPVTEQDVQSEIVIDKKNELKLDLTGKTILIAEDEEYNYELINIFVTNAGAKTIRAVTGKEVVDIINKKKNIDLILMDIKMPVINGLEATRQIRKSNNSIPIIAQTAYAQVGDRDKILKAGCNDYISKPIQKSKLFELIGKYI